MDLFYILLGILILYCGGESLVRGSVLIAKHLKISPIFVGSVIIGFGTSLTEVTVSIEAMLKDAPEIAIGNVIGSNIANIFFILGICALISPFSVTNNRINKDVWVMLFATIILSIFGLFGKLNFLEGILMLLFLFLYIFSSYLKDKNYSDSKSKNDEINNELGWLQNLNLPLSFLLSIIGILLLIIGSSLFLDGSISLANYFQIEKEIIGLTIISFGSCLPEITTATVAAYKKRGSIVMASIVGSNIFNILSIVGIISLMGDITIPEHILKFDLWLFLGSTILLAIMIFRKIQFNRIIGCNFLLAYILYIYSLFIF